MANLTLTIDDDMLKRARIRALENGTSVNAVVRRYLETYANPEATEQAMREFGALADRAQAGSGPAGRAWTRDDLYADIWKSGG